MSTTAIPPTSSSSSSTPTSALANDKLNMQDFLQLMTTQLQNQDPLNPTSDADYFAQIAQLGTVQGIDTLNNSSQVQQAQALMGKTVTATNTNAAATGGPANITGTVQSLSVQSGVYYLGIQTADGTINSVPLTALQNVQSNQSLTNASDLIGKTVTGTASVGGQTQTITGDVASVGLLNGVPTATVTLSNKQTATVPVSGLTSISD